MEQSPSWEANSFSASQKIPCILWKPKIHYRINNVRTVTRNATCTLSKHNFILQVESP